MDQLLAQYLFQYKKLSIPGVGTLEMIEQSPQFNVVDKLMMPPSYSCRLQPADRIPEHQLLFLSLSMNKAPGETRQELDTFGARLKEKASDRAVRWKGIGTLSAKGGALSLEADTIPAAGLQPVPAHKIIRENAAHAMLVGDRERTTVEMSDSLRQVQPKRQWTVLVGWIILALAVLAIIFFIYNGKGSPMSSGLQF